MNMLLLLLHSMLSLAEPTKDPMNIDTVPSVVDDGKWYIIELTSLCTKDTSKHLNYDAVRQHLKLRYLIGRQQRLAPRMNFGFASFDVCNDFKALTSVLSNIFLEEKYRGYDNNPRTNQNECGSVRSCTEDVNKLATNILVVISHLPTRMTQYTSEILSVYYIPYFAYTTDTDTHHALLSTQYQFFFTTDMFLYSDIQIVTFNYILKYGFKHIVFVSIKYDGETLQAFHRERFFRELTYFHDICVEMKEIDITEIKSCIEEIKNDETIRMIILWGRISIHEAFINETIGMSDRVWLWYSDGTYMDFHNLDNYKSEKNALLNHIFVQHPFFTYQSLRDRFSYGTLKKWVRQDTYQSILDDSWIKRFNKEQELNTTEPDLFSHFDANVSIAGENTEAMILPIWYVQPFRRLRYDPLNLFYERLFATTRIQLGKFVFEADNTREFKFDLNHIESHFERISNISKGEYRPRICQAGFEPKKEVFVKEGFVKVFQWHCVSCREGLVKFKNGTHPCTTCPGLTVPNDKKTECYDPYEDEFLNYTDTKSIVLLSLIAPCTVFNLLAIIVYAKYRSTPIMTASGAIVSLIQLHMHLVISVQVIPTFFGKLNMNKCIFQVVVFGVLLTLILSFLFTKTHKMIYAFNAQVQISKVDVIISKAVEIFVSVTLVLIQILIGVLGYFQLKPSIEIILNASELTRKTKCQNMSYFRAHYIYILVLTLLCSIQAFRARNLPKYFTETAEIAYSMYIALLIIIIRFPIVASNQIVDKNLANAVFILVTNNLLMFLRFTKPVFIVLFQPAKNTKEHVRNAIMERVRKDTEQRMAERIRKNTSTTTLESNI